MGKLLNVMNPLHKQAKRDYLPRMIDNKVECMKVAKEFGKDFWDGDRRYGYGGYRYDGRWQPVAKNLIENYQDLLLLFVLNVTRKKGGVVL